MIRTRQRHRARSSKHLNRLRRKLAAERLEDRKMLDASALLDGGTVIIEANDDDNVIEAYVQDGWLTVEVDDIKFEYENHLVDHIKIDAKGGNDSIVIQRTVGQTTTLDGGDGNDRIHGSRQNDTINGGSGNDFLQGGWANDAINGGLGNDVLVGDPADIYPVPVPTPIDAELTTFEDVVVEAIDPEVVVVTGFDTLVGGRGNDRLLGMLGNDRMDGGLGNDIANGGSGNDFIQGRLRLFAFTFG